MRLTSAIEDFITACRNRGLNASTVVRYKSDLRFLSALAEVTAKDSVLAFTPELVAEYFSAMSKKGLANATLHRRRAVLSEFARYCLDRRLVAEHPLSALRPIRRPKKLPRPFTPEERGRLVALHLDRDDSVIRALLYWTGFRVSEIADLRIGNVSFQALDLGDGVIWPGSLRIIGKGNVERVIPMHAELKDILFDYVVAGSSLQPRDWVLRRRDLRRGTKAADGKVYPWTRKMLERRTREWGKRAGVSPCTPHRFRHTLATVLLEAGVDVRVIQQWLGHADLSTTQIYTQVVNRELAKALAKLPSTAAAPEQVDSDQRAERPSGRA